MFSQACVFSHGAISGAMSFPRRYCIGGGGVGGYQGRGIYSTPRNGGHFSSRYSSYCCRINTYNCVNMCSGENEKWVKMFWGIPLSHLIMDVFGTKVSVIGSYIMHLPLSSMSDSIY